MAAVLDLVAAVDHDPLGDAGRLGALRDHPGLKQVSTGSSGLGKLKVEPSICPHRQF
jgi:hypothetical protein